MEFDGCLVLKSENKGGEEEEDKAQAITAKVPRQSQTKSCDGF